MKTIDSEFVISYYELFLYKNIPYLVMEYYENDDLYEINLMERIIKIFTIFTKILLGLHELHKQ